MEDELAVSQLQERIDKFHASLDSRPKPPAAAEPSPEPCIEAQDIDTDPEGLLAALDAALHPLQQDPSEAQALISTLRATSQPHMLQAADAYEWELERQRLRTLPEFGERERLEVAQRALTEYTRTDISAAFAAQRATASAQRVMDNAVDFRVGWWWWWVG